MSVVEWDLERPRRPANVPLERGGGAGRVQMTAYAALEFPTEHVGWVLGDATDRLERAAGRGRSPR